MPHGSLGEAIRRTLFRLRDGGSGTDAQLLERFVASHDEAAFTELVRRHGPMVQRVCQRVLRHSQDAEDAFQATFIVLAKKAAVVNPPDLLGNWLYGVSYRIACKARSLAGRRHGREQAGAALDGVAAPDGVGADGQGVMDEELQALPARYRAPLVLAYLEGRSNAEVASMLGSSLRTVERDLSRGRDLLRERLTRRGLTTAAVAGLLTAAPASAALPARWLAASHTGLENAATGLSPQVAALADAGVQALATTGRRWAVGVLLASIGLAGAAAWLVLNELKPAGAEVWTAQPALTGHTGPVMSLAAAADGSNRLLSGSKDGTARLWDLGAGAETAVLGGHAGAVIAVGFLDGARAVTVDATGVVRQWDLPSRRELGRVEHGGPVEVAAVSPDRRWLATAGAEGKLWDLRTMKLQRPFRPGVAAEALAFTPDSQSFAVAAWNARAGGVRMFDVAQGDGSPWITHTVGRYRHIAYSPDGRILATPSVLDATIRLWDTTSWQQVGPLHQQSTSATAVCFAPDGRTVASGGTDGVKVWDVATQRELAAFGERNQAVAALVFADDGRSLIAGCFAQGAIRRWQLSNR